MASVWPLGPLGRGFPWRGGDSSRGFLSRLDAVPGLHLGGLFITLVSGIIMVFVGAFLIGEAADLHIGMDATE